MNEPTNVGGAGDDPPLAPFGSLPTDGIRRARLEDIAVLQQIAAAAKRHWNYPEEWIREWRDALTLRDEHLATQVVFVAERSDAVIGFCSLVPESTNWSLEHMWVLPDFMGLGVGDALFKRVVTHAEQSRGAAIMIESDPHAEGFYERMGAKRVGRVAAPVAGTERYLPLLELRLR